MLPLDAHERLIDTLKTRYPLFTKHGEQYPLVYLPPASTQINDIDSVLASNYPQTLIDRDQFAFYDSAHLQALQADGRTLTNGVSYVMDRLETVDSDGHLRIHAKLGHYFDMLATCDALDHELRRYASGQAESLPNRDCLHGHISESDIVNRGDGRCVIIGGATLTVFNHNGEYQAIVAQRSQQVATGAGLHHVLPAFVFQPSGRPDFYAGEWSLSDQIMREFGEELFAMPEYDAWQTPVTSYDYFYEYPPIKDLREMLADGRAQILLTGIAFNLLSTRPEICALLMIHDATWYTRWQPELEQASNTERQKTVYIPIVDDQAILSTLPQHPARHFAPQGAAALWLGIDQARKVLKGH